MRPGQDRLVQPRRRFRPGRDIDPAFTDEAVMAFFDAIRRDARLPKIIRLRSFEADPVVYPAMLKHLADSGRYRELFRAGRPFADRAFASRKSGSSRKKLRQLSTSGAVDIVNERSLTNAEAAFEIFLRLEAESWKGREGTALLCDVADARFARRLIWNLAACGLASVALLGVDGDAIAAQVLLYSGQRACTWKTAFKASFARFSPGVLVVDQAARSLFESGQITTIDSCSAPGGFMGQLFTDRRTFVDALIDVRRRNALVFALETAQHRGYELLRRARSRIRHIVVSRRRAFSN